MTVSFSFHLTGEVVRQTLDARDIPYEPYLYATDLFDRAWPRFNAPMERYWQEYIDGAASLEDAARSVVSAID